MYFSNACFIGPETGSCYAARPRYWREEGYRALPCSDQLNFACEKNRRYALPMEPPQRFWSSAALTEPVDDYVGLRPYTRLLPPRRLGPIRRRHLLRRILAGSGGGYPLYL